MKDNANSSIFSKWTDEFSITLMQNNSFCIAIFSVDRELIFANNSMSALFKGEPYNSFINPTFDTLLLLDNSNPLIFDGFLTLGDYSSVNTSILVQIYRKENNLLIVGGVNASQLLEQNETMHQLNREISNLQRELIREKHNLENTLKQLNHANIKLKELNATKDKFFGIIAHDLRHPFNSILGFSDLLMKNIAKYDTEKINKFVETIHSSGQSAYNLLENLLEWSRAQTGNIEFKPEKFILENLFIDVITLSSTTAAAKNITINYEILDSLIVYADQNMLKTVMRNLIGNAIKFTKQNGNISVMAVLHNNEITVTVSDTGVGMDEIEMNKLFKTSEKVSTTGTAGEKGTGLGLLLCKEFVEKHDGKIWVESKAGKGSDFKFSLPIKLD